jgi:hypothetical protein
MDRDVQICIGIGALGLLATIASRTRGSASRPGNRARVQAMLDQMPPKWKRELEAARKEQRSLGLGVTPENPSVEEVIETVLEITAGNRKPGTSKWAGERGAQDIETWDELADEAMHGLELSFREDYPSWKFIGLARGMQLATRPKIWRRSLKRIKGYLSRHRKDKLGRGFGNDAKPSKGYMAYLIWGGSEAEDEWSPT